MCVRISDVSTRLRYVTSKMTVVIILMSFLVAQIVLLRVIATRVGDSRQAQTTLTGDGKKEKRQVWELDPRPTTPWEQQM